MAASEQLLNNGPYPDVTTLRLGCGTDTRADQHNVDRVPLDGVDELVDLNSYPWPWDDGRWSYIVAEHVFEHLDDIEQALRECARVLEPGGRLRVVMPMGVNAVADPDHEHLWTWQTPGFYCGARHWDVDVGLSVVTKRVDMHSLYTNPVLDWVQQAKWWLASRTGAGEWCFNQPAMSGSFEVVFEA